MFCMSFPPPSFTRNLLQTFLLVWHYCPLLVLVRDTFLWLHMLLLYHLQFNFVIYMQISERQ